MLSYIIETTEDGSFSKIDYSDDSGKLYTLIEKSFASFHTAQSWARKTVHRLNNSLAKSGIDV